MSPKEIIDSGILEEYMVGALSEKESQEITRLCSEYPELAEEVKAIEATLLQSFSVPVNSEWKKEILSSLNETPVKPIGVNHQIDGKVIPITSAHDMVSAKSSQKWFWAAASFAGLFLISSAANFMLLNKNQSLAQELTDTKVKLINESEEKSVFAANFKKSQTDYQQLFNHDFERIEMKGTPAFADKSSILFWNPTSGEVIWDGSSLPELSAEQQYQLWAIVDGKPQNAGMFTSDVPSKMLEAVSAQAFAVTIEPVGGSVSPTLEKMVVVAPISTKTT